MLSSRSMICLACARSMALRRSRAITQVREASARKPRGFAIARAIFSASASESDDAEFLQAIARLAGDMPFGIPTDVHFGTPSPSGGVLRARAIGDPRAVLGWTDRHTATAGWPSPNHDDAAGPVRFQVDRKSQAALTPFEHRLIARETAFRILPESANDSIQSIMHSPAMPRGMTRSSTT